MPHSDMQNRAVFMLKMLAVAVLYALLAHASHLYAMSNGNGISVVWPSGGLALAAVLIGGKRYAWSVFIGSLLMANVMAVGAIVWADIIIALGNTLAALFGAWLLTRNARFEPSITSLNVYLRLILLGGCIASLVSALVGNSALLVSGFIVPAEYLYSALRWWMGDVLGIILITPLILSCCPNSDKQPASMAGVFEGILLFGLMFFVGQIVFLDWFHDYVGAVAKVYWVFLFIIWVAVRLGVRGVTLALCVTAIQALWGVYYGVGFFEHDIEETQLVNLWLYMVTLAVIGMALAVYIAEHKLAEEALRRSQTKLKALYDSTSDALMLLDENGFFDCNQAALTMFGCADKQEFCSKHPADLSPALQPCGAASLTLSKRQVTKAMEQGSNFFEWMHRRLDNGMLFPADVLLNSMVLDGKTVLQATVRDISGRKQTENVLRKLSLAVEQSPSSIVITDLGGNIEYVNLAFVNETGYSAGEMIGQNPRLLSSGKNPQAVYAQMWACLMRGEVWKGELINRRKDGSEYIESALISPVRQDGGHVTHYLAIKENISSRKHNEAKIARLSSTYRLLSRVNEAIVRARDKDELFATICNVAVESGLFRFSWISMLDGFAVKPVDFAGIEQGYTENLDIRLDDECTSNGPICRAIRANVHMVCDDIASDPSMAPWRDAALQRGYNSLAAFPIRDEGCVVGTINVYAAQAYFFTPDILDLMLELAADLSFALEVFAEKQRREQAEIEIKRLNVGLEHRVMERTRQLEAANKELEAFSYSVSHDLRAPLRSIDGFSRVLLQKYHDKLDENGRDWLERMRRASQHMGHLIDDMLKLSLVASGPLHREPTDLSKIAEWVADELKKNNPERQVEFVIQQGLTAQADAGLLRIVMDNLLGNAWKFTGKKDNAKIEFGICDIEGVHVYFVRDNGDGFNMDYAHKLFGVFQRLHTTNEFEGTGIGLATVQRVIHRHLAACRT